MKRSTEDIRKELDIKKLKDYERKVRDKLWETTGVKLPLFIVHRILSFFLRNVILALTRGDEVRIKGYIRWMQYIYPLRESKAFLEYSKRKVEASSSQ